MPDSQPPPIPGDDRYDWDAIRARLVASIRHHLGSCQPERVEDLAQEGAIRFLRCARRERVENPDALAWTIGQKVAIDEIRRKKADPLVPLDPNFDPPGEPPPPDIALRWWLLLELLRLKRETCLPYALAFAQHGNWKDAAKSLGVSHDAVRQNWHRCLVFVRDLLRRHPDLFPELLDTDD